MGLTKRMAGELMSTVGPALSVETVSWLIHTWEVFEKWLIELNRRMARQKGWAIPNSSFEDPKSNGIRSAIRILFFVGGNTPFPASIESVIKQLKIDLENNGINLLGFGLNLPTSDKYKKILQGVDVLLPHFPLRY
jgi:hypothetical protein